MIFMKLFSRSSRPTGAEDARANAGRHRSFEDDGGVLVEADVARRATALFVVRTMTALTTSPFTLPPGIASRPQRR